MKKIERLRKEALEICESKNHEMKRFIRFEDIAISHCTVCSEAVAIDANPRGRITICGGAIVLNCKGHLQGGGQHANKD